MQMSKYLLSGTVLTALLGVFIANSGDTAATDSASGAVDPITGLPIVRPRDKPFQRVTLNVHGRGFALDRLYEAAVSYLTEKEQAPSEVITNAAATVFVTNRDALCEFYFSYSGLVGRPVWHVIIGLDGKVKSCFKAVATEGLPPRVTVPPPPPEAPPPKLPK